MDQTLTFSDLLTLIDERSTAFRAAIAAAPSLDAQVPTCPEWTLFDLAQHIGDGRRRWATIVAAGPAAAPPTTSVPADAPTVPREREALLAWLAAATQELLDALRAAGPDRGCWTWWGPSQSPETCGAVARHQLHQFAVHTYDAQLTVGAAQPLPTEIALDCVEEFLTTCCATTVAWPHEPATVDYRADEGPSWRLWLSADGARTARLPEVGDATGESQDAADAFAQGTANDLVLFLYGRIQVESLHVVPDRRVFDQLVDWDPDA